MTEFGKPLSDSVKKRMQENAQHIKGAEKEIAAGVDKVKKAGLPAETLNQRGEWTVYQRLEYLLDAGSWCPLHTLYDPMDEESGTTGVVDGLGRIGGRWAEIGRASCRERV